MVEVPDGLTSILNIVSERLLRACTTLPRIPGSTFLLSTVVEDPVVGPVFGSMSYFNDGQMAALPLVNSPPDVVLSYSTRIYAELLMCRTSVSEALDAGLARLRGAPHLIEAYKEVVSSPEYEFALTRVHGDVLNEALAGLLAAIGSAEVPSHVISEARLVNDFWALVNHPDVDRVLRRAATTLAVGWAPLLP